MRVLTSSVVALLLIFTTGLQAGNAQTAFEVASIKPAAPSGSTPAGVAVIGGCMGGPGTRAPNLLTCQSVSLFDLITLAYGLFSYQIVGPPWLADEKFDVFARVPEGTNRDALRIMEQKLLEERFHLVAHNDRRKVPGYELEVDKGGPQVERAADSPNSGPQSSGRSSIKGAGVGIRLEASGEPIERLARHIASILGAPVFDATGLKGNYNYAVSYVPAARSAATAKPGVIAASSDPKDLSGGPETSGPTIFEAVQKQLGLRLRRAEVLVDVLVIDSAQRTPTAN